MKKQVYTIFLFLLLLPIGSYAQQSLEGFVRTDYGRPMPNVKMILYPFSGFPIGPAIDSTLTDTNGFYRFENLQPGSFLIDAKKHTHPLNGVSLQDVIKISREIILAIEEFKPEHRIYAADITNNGIISTFDLIYMQKHLLGIEPLIPPGWAFLDYRVVVLGFPPPQLAFASGAFEILDSSITDANFLVYKPGDVTGNAAINLFIDSEDRSGHSPHQLQIPDLALQAGQSYRLQLRTAEPLEISGYQLALRYNTEAINLLTSEPNTEGLWQTKTHFNNSDGWFRAIGYEKDTRELEVGHGLLELHIKAQQSGSLSEFLKIDEETLKAETYDAALNAHPLHLQFSAPTQAVKPAFRVAPNPFSGSTRFEFYLEAPAPVQVSIFDATGRKLQTVQAHYGSGQHQLQLSGEALPKNQLLYFQFEAAGQLEVGKIFQQD